MNRAYKFRLQPNKQQIELLNKWEGSARWLWNYFVALEQQEYATNKKFVWGYDLIKLIPGLKKQHPWLKEAYAASLQQVGLTLEKALKRIKQVPGTGFPKFKKKHVSNGQILIPNRSHTVIPNKSHIHLPKIGKVKWVSHRDLPTGKIKQASITKDIDNWFVTLVIELPDIIKLPVDPTTAISIGIDLGIKHFIVDSNGNKTDSPKFLLKKIIRVKRYQRQLSRKQKGSNNRAKARKKFAKIHRDIRNARKDWLDKLSHELVTKHEIICAEDLKTKDLMTRKSTKSLNRQIADQGWGMFLHMLKYKSEQQGKTFTQIGQYAPSSKTCSSCGYRISGMGLNIRDWVCPSCGAAHDRDLNAAKNILVWGLLTTPNTAGTAGINACGVSNLLVDDDHQVEVVEDTMKQESGSSEDCQ